jgi:hypothetical protein
MNFRYILFVSNLFLAGCSSSIGPETAPLITGSYLFAEYTTAITLDTQPTGTATVTATDDSHVSILVKGTSGKTKISYSYTNVSVNGPGPDAYSLVYRGKSIGEAGNDGLNRYLTLNPTASTMLKAIEY